MTTEGDTFIFEDMNGRKHKSKECSMCGLKYFNDHKDCPFCGKTNETYEHP